MPWWCVVVPHLDCLPRFLLSFKCGNQQICSCTSKSHVLCYRSPLFGVPMSCAFRSFNLDLLESVWSRRLSSISSIQLYLFDSPWSPQFTLISSIRLDLFDSAWSPQFIRSFWFSLASSVSDKHLDSAWSWFCAFSLIQFDSAWCPWFSLISFESVGSSQISWMSVI